MNKPTFRPMNTINFSMFVDGFNNRKDNFSYLGLRALFNDLKELGLCLEHELEFNPIAICCEYTEESTQYFIENYGILDEINIDGMDEKEVDEVAVEWLDSRTRVVRVNENTIIVQDF